MARRSRFLSPELRQALSGTLPITLLLFAVSFIVAAGVQTGIALNNRSLGFADHFSQGTLNAFATFAALELAALLVQAARLKGLIEKQNSLLGQTINRDKEVKEASHAISILNAYRRRNAPMHEAVGKALLYTIENIRLSDDHVSVQGEQMAVASYRWFWSHVLEAQQVARKNGAEDISVFVTHSAPITFWQNPDLQPVISLQHDFLDAGGVLNRIFIDRTGHQDGLPIYANVIKNMRSTDNCQDTDERRNIFYLRMSEEDQILDFMLTRFRGKYYASEWNPRHIGTNNSDIASCDFYAGRGKFEDLYWVKWKNAVNLLRAADQARVTREFAAASLDEAQRAILLLRPDETQYEAMLDFPI